MGRISNGFQLVVRRPKEGRRTEAVRMAAEQDRVNELFRLRGFQRCGGGVRVIRKKIGGV